MRKRWSARGALAVSAYALASLGAAAAQRTFVATYGSDAGACSLAAPCRQLAAALAKTDADGEIVVLDSGGFGPVAIGKSVTIAASPGAHAAITVFSGNGVTVNGTDVKVTLRGLRINGQGGASGIFFQQGSELHVEDCTISNMGDNGIDVRAPDSRTFVSRSVLRSNAHSGLYADAFDGPVTVTVTRSEVARNYWGLYVRQGARIGVVDTTIAGNLLGVYVNVDNPGASSGSEAAVDGGTISDNFIGVSLSSTHTLGSVAAAFSRAGLHNNTLAGSVYATAGYAELALTNVHSNFATFFVNGMSTHLSLASNAFTLAGLITCSNGGTVTTYGNSVMANMSATGCNVLQPSLK